MRRKSGTGNEKRAVRPSGTLTRRNTPQYVSKVVGPSGAAKLREKERERSRQEERDSLVDEDSESFPQFWYVHLSISCCLVGIGFSRHWLSSHCCSDLSHRIITIT